MYLCKKSLQDAFHRQQNFVSDSRESPPQVASLKLVHQRQPQVPQSRHAHTVELRSTSIPRHGAEQPVAFPPIRESASENPTLINRSLSEGRCCIFACDN
jgi:hypothetical protein